MASLQSYSGLVENIQEALEDDSQEFQDYIPTAIKLAQFRISRETDQENVELNIVVSGTAGQVTIAKPSGYLLNKTLSFVDANGQIKVLRKQTKSFINRFWIYGATSVGEPKYYGDYSNSQFMLAPTPDLAYNYECTYVSRPAGLSVGNETNVFTTWIPDALFHASMVEMCRFSRNGELLQYHEAGYINSMQAVNNEARRARREDGMQPLNPNVQVNTLKGDN